MTYLSYMVKMKMHGVVWVLFAVTRISWKDVFAYCATRSTCALELSTHGARALELSTRSARASEL